MLRKWMYTQGLVLINGLKVCTIFFYPKHFTWVSHWDHFMTTFFKLLSWLISLNQSGKPASWSVITLKKMHKCMFIVSNMSSFHHPSKYFYPKGVKIQNLQEIKPAKLLFGWPDQNPYRDIHVQPLAVIYKQTYVYLILCWCVTKNQSDLIPFWELEAKIEIPNLIYIGPILRRREEIVSANILGESRKHFFFADLLHIYSKGLTFKFITIPAQSNISCLPTNNSRIIYSPLLPFHINTEASSIHIFLF